MKKQIVTLDYFQYFMLIAVYFLGLMFLVNSTYIYYLAGASLFWILLAVLSKYIE